MAHRDDVVPADECVDLAILDLVVFQTCDLQDDEDLIIVEIDFRYLRRTHRVLDSQAMQPEPFLQDREVAVERIEHFDPDEL